MLADVETVGGLAGVTMTDDDTNRLYSEIASLRSRFASLELSVAREVTIAQQRRPVADQQFAELKQLARENRDDIAEIKSLVHDMTTVIRVVRWGIVTVTAGGAATIMTLGGWWYDFREAVRTWLS